MPYLTATYDLLANNADEKEAQLWLMDELKEAVVRLREDTLREPTEGNPNPLYEAVLDVQGPAFEWIEKGRLLKGVVPYKRSIPRG